MHESESNLTMAPQIFGDQPLILRTLAEVCSNEGSNFLEVGSWYGDSTLILGEVAKKRNGHLFCVDWWRGNPGTELDEIAKKEDIFALFWRRVQRNRLDDVVIPIRSRSEFLSGVLAKKTFSFVFIDGDHRYQAVLDDIRNYAPLVRRGGIFCGHDCEGYLVDFDEDFLERGRDLDYYETVHCGVVLAVGQSFENYSIDNSIWSVKSSGNDRWTATSLELTGFKRKRQEPPPPIAAVREHHIFRYGNKVYAVPFHLDLTDITDEALRSHSEVIATDSVLAAEGLIPKQHGEPRELILLREALEVAKTALKEKDAVIASLQNPSFVGFTRKYSVWKGGTGFYALPHSGGSLDLSKVQIRETAESLSADSIQALEEATGEAVSNSPVLIESYGRFNLVAFKQKVHGLALALGPIDLGRITDEELDKHVAEGTCVIGKSIEQAKLKIDRLELSLLLGEKENTAAQLQKSLQAGQVALSEKQNKIEELNRAIADGEILTAELQQTVHAQQVLLLEGQTKIEELRRNIEEQKGEIQSLKVELEKVEITLELSRL